MGQGVRGGPDPPVVILIYLRLEPYGTRPRTSEATLCSRCFLETAGARSPHRGPQPAHSTARVQQPSARPDGPTAADGLSAGSVPAQCRLTVPAQCLRILPAQCPPHYLEPSALGPALPRCIHEEAEEAAQPPSLRAPSMPARGC